MLLSQKSLNFAKIILKHNPISQRHQHTHQQSENNSSNCSNHHHLQQKPYLHVHDHRKVLLSINQISNAKSTKNLPHKNYSEGNQHFRSRRYQQATHYYNKVIIFGDYTFPEHEKEQKQMDELIQQANCNLGMSLVKLGEDTKAIQHFTQASKGPGEKNIIKSLYWLAKCLIKSGEFTKAEHNLSRLKTYEDKTRTEVAELDIQLKKAIENYEKKSKGVFEQMFGGKVAGLKNNGNGELGKIGSNDV